ncbi:hypothetical protein SBRCBS47491_000910 [Sporothrix bragantina]|uniref:SET domain-containing protein n=1 Tax=Sporothrix bragantina TaxID=671064 RepID=A0ABP0AU89_9PEZI
MSSNDTFPTIEAALAQIKAQKLVLQQAKKHAGEPPPASDRRSRARLDREFSEWAAQLATISPGEMPLASAFMAEAYPPSTASLSSLTPIYLADLRLETHHRGRVLIVRTFSQPNRMTAIQNAVEDVYGSVERLAVYNVLPTVKPEALLPKNTIVAIKEPYYKRTGDGGLFVRVDHPTDLAVLRAGDALMPQAWAPLVDRAVDVKALKRRGNREFGKKQWLLAEETYTEALDELGRSQYVNDGVDDKDNDDHNLCKTLHRNRAAARLNLGRYELAREDALNSVILDSADRASDNDTVAANSKALYRAGQAAYFLGDYTQAQQHFQAAIDLYGDAETETKMETKVPTEIIDAARRIQQRLDEQATGLYDWPAIAAAVNKTNCRLDHASFLRQTRVDASVAGQGRGLFVTQDVRAGDVVFVEKALCVLHSDDYGPPFTQQILMNVNSDRVTMGPHSLLLYNLTELLQWNPTLAEKYFDLHDGRSGEKEKVVVVDGRAAIDTFRVQAIVELNAFACPRIASGTREEDIMKQDGKEGLSQSMGIWRHASYMNHDCLPNVTRSFIGDLMIVRAVHDLKAGDELLTVYVAASESLDARQSHLRHYGFTCQCALCITQQRVAPSMRV